MPDHIIRYSYNSIKNATANAVANARAHQLYKECHVPSQHKIATATALQKTPERNKRLIANAGVQFLIATSQHKKHYNAAANDPN